MIRRNPRGDTPVVHESAFVDHDRLRIHEPPGTVDEPHALGFEQGSHRDAQLLLDAGDPCPEGIDVELTVRSQAHQVRAPQSGQFATRRDHGLRRHTIQQVRGTTDEVTLDERHVGAEGCRNRRRGVAGRAASENY